jgi:outer membrane protein OmpA-like peptidoglycan-associated protein
LATTKIVITGLASKTGSPQVNERIATERANNAKNVIAAKYPAIVPNNIVIEYKIQPEDDAADVSMWQ